MIDLYSIILLHNSSVVQVFMDFIFPQSMLNIAFFYCFIPGVIKLMNLAGNFLALIEIIGLVNF